MLKKRFSAVRPILEAAGEAVKVCLLPIPRYVKSSCCGDERHIINLQETDYEDILLGSQDKLCWAECLEGERPCPPDVRRIQGHCEPHPAPGWQPDHQCTSLWSAADQQHHPRAAAVHRSGPRVSARVDYWHGSGQGRLWQRRQGAGGSVGTAAEAAATAPTPTKSVRISTNLEIQKW